jgi:regulatory protein
MATPGKTKKLDADALWNYALRALGQRPHSTNELKQKLFRRAESMSAVTTVMAKLEEYGFADDRKFSEAFASARLSNQGFGRLRVLRELRSKSVGKRVAEEAVEKTFLGIDESELIERFLNRKYRGKDLASFLRDQKNLASAYRRLRTAGFSAAGSISALKKYVTQIEEWEPDGEDE